MNRRRVAMLLMLAASQARAQPTVAPPQAAPQGPIPAAKWIFVPPPVQWDNPMLNYSPALQQTESDFTNLTGGLAFGMSPADVDALLPKPFPGVSWNALPLAAEYPGEVRYFGVPLDRAGTLRMGLTACVGRDSYIAFLFTDRGLFRMSYRLLADKGCGDTNEAAEEIFARYVTIGQTIALSTRYHAGRTQVVDVTDTTAGYLTPTRWRQAGN